MPYNRKTTGMPNVDRVVNDIYSILDRFKPAVVVGGESGGITDHRDLNNLNSENYCHLTEVEYNSFLDILDIGEDVSWDDITDKPSNISALSSLSVTNGNFIASNGTTFISRKLQNSDLPAIAITDTFIVSSQAAMLALSTAERGDVAVRTDLNKSFILKGDDYSELEDWQELLTPTDTVLSVDGRTGVIDLSDRYQPLDTDLTTIAALTHSNRHVMVSNGSSWTRRALEEDDLPSLSISKITNLQDNLDGKQSIIPYGTTGIEFYAWDKTMKAVDWTYVANKPSSFTPAAHGLVSSAHTVSGLTTGHVLKATGATTYGFGAIAWTDIASKPSTFTPSAHGHDSVYAKLSLGTIRSSGGFATSLETGRDVFASGLYTYRFMGDALNKPAGISLGSVLTWGHGVAGAGQLAVGWTAGDHNKLVFRSLRDTKDDWWAWKEIYHTGYKPTPDDIGAAPAITGTENKVLSIKSGGTGVKTGVLSDDGTKATVAGNIIGSGARLLLGVNTLDEADNKYAVITAASDWSKQRSGAIIVYGNEHGEAGLVRVSAGNGTTSKTGAIFMDGKAYFGSRPANDHRWTLALDQYNTFYGFGSGMNIMHNLYHDGSYWRYRYGSGSNSGGVVTTLDYNKFSVNVADNGVADQIATLKHAIHTNLSGNTAFGKSTFVGGYRLEVEGNQLIGGNATIGGNAAFGGTVHLNGNIKILNKAGNGYIDFLTRNTSGTEAVADLSNVGSLAMEAASPFLTITPYSNGGIVFNTPSGPDGQHAHWITRSANDGVLSIAREVNGQRSLMMAFAPNVNDILFDSDLYIQGEVFAHDKITIYSNPTGGNIIVPHGLDIRGGTEGSGYTGRLELGSSIASLSLVNTTSRYTVATDFVMEESDHVVSSGIKHEVYEQITSSSANYNPGKSLLRLWHSEAMTIVFANLPSNPTGYNTAAMFTVFNPSSVTHSVNGVSIWPNQSRQFIYDYSASKWMTSY